MELTGDQAAARIAARHHGLIRREEALAVGFVPDAIKGRIASGRWEVIAPGVYRIGGAPPTWQQATLAACHGAPEDAVASHQSAAALAGLGNPPPQPHITVAYGRGTELSTAVVHRTRLALVDVDHGGVIPVTTPARTLIDCAGIVGPTWLRSMVDESFHRRLVVAADVDAALSRAGKRRGSRLLRELLEPWRMGIAPDSPAEVRLLRVVVAWGFPPPETQVVIRDHRGEVIARADIGWADRRIAIDYDGERWHGPSHWHRDEARHRRVVAAGWALLHADKTDVLPGADRLRGDLERAWRATNPALCVGSSGQ